MLTLGTPHPDALSDCPRLKKCSRKEKTMAVREFQGVIDNKWENPVIRTADDVDGGQWQEPWFPSKVPGAGRIETSQEGEWRSESDGVATGTSGWARWAARVVDPSENPAEHFEF